MAISASRIAITPNSTAPPIPPIAGAERHEGEEHQHAAIAFKIRGVEDFDPDKAGADAERGAAERAQQQTQQHKQRNFHGGFR